MKEELNAWVNTHKYVVTVTVVAVVAVMMLRNKSAVIVTGDSKDVLPMRDGMYGYVTFK